MTVEVTGLEEMKKLYEEDSNFALAWRACKEPWSYVRTPYFDYFIQEWFLSKNNQLCVPRVSMRKKLIRKLHNGGLSSHFSVDNIKALVEE